MKPIPAIAVSACAALFLAAPLWAQDSTCTGPVSDTKLYVDVEGIKSSQGLIAVTLYADDSSKFLAKRGSLYVGRVSAVAPKTRVCIYLPKPGVYGIAVYHDANGNRNIDRSGIGIPTEAVGFSNNPKLFLSIPSFKSVRLSVPRSGMVAKVTLRYP